MHSNKQQDELLDFTSQLVKAPSLSGAEDAVAVLVQAKMKALAYDNVWVDEYGNVIGMLVGRQPGPHLLFDAHMDVVPATQPENWSRDPFGGEVWEGRVWGRGATDIKGGVAALVIGLGNLPRSDVRGTLFVSATVGEEVMEGAAMRPVVDHTRPDFAVIVEPTGCRLGIAQKGRTEFWVQVMGTPSHTSRPELGDNAIYRSADIIQELRRLARPVDAFLGRAEMELIEIISSPFPGNCIVPDGCHLRYDRRLLPGETREGLMKAIQTALSSHSRWTTGLQPVRLECYTGKVVDGEQYYPAWSLPEGSPWLEKAIRGLAKAGLPIDTIPIPYCTNASYTAGIAGIPTVVFGPSHIDLAHIVDEYVESTELTRAMAGFINLAKTLGE